MKSRVMKILSLALALMMVVCVFAACGKDTGEGSDEVEITYVDQYGNPIDPDSLNSKDDDSTASDGDTASTDDKTDDTGSKQTASRVTGGKTSSNAVVTGKTKFEADPYSDIPASLKGSTVDVLLWRTPEATDVALAEAFEKKTGIKVKYDYTPNNTAAYATRLATRVSSKDSPDLVSMGSGSFPSFAISYLEPLDKEVFRLDDPFWNKSFMDCYKINGKYYCLAASGTWYCDDVNYVTYYNPAALKQNGIETTPYQIWKQNKSAWTIDKMIELARKFKAKDDTFHGISYQSNTIPNPYMLSSGVDFVKYNGKEFTSNLSNTTVLNLSMQFADWYSEGLIEGWNSEGVGKGTVAFFDAISYGMYKDANWFTIPTTQVECVPVAGTHTPANPKVWGIPKNAKNAQGAAYFLRFFLDSESFKETSFGSFENTFATAQMHEVFMYMSAASTPKTINITRGVLDYYDTSAYNQFISKLNATTSANIKTELDTYSRTMDAACNRANKKLSTAQSKPSYVK